jgi:hypothetical protein
LSAFVFKERAVTGAVRQVLVMWQYADIFIEWLEVLSTLTGNNGTKQKNKYKQAKYWNALSEKEN